MFKRMSSEKHHITYKILGIFQSITAVGAIPAGLSMIFQPDGTGIGLSTGILEGSPFNNYIIPGLFLFFVNGLANVFGVVLSFRKSKKADVFGLSLGILLVMWICIQVWITGLIHFLQPTFFVIGVIEIVSSYILRLNRISNHHK